MDSNKIVVGKYDVPYSLAAFIDQGTEKVLTPYKHLSKTYSYPTVWKATVTGERPGDKTVLGAIDLQGREVFIAQARMPNGYHIGYYIPDSATCAKVGYDLQSQCCNNFDLLYINP